jgi:hypothetical protein
VPCPSRLRFHHFSDIWGRVQIMKFLIKQFSVASCYYPSQFQIRSSAPCSQTHSVYVFLSQWERRSFAPTQTFDYFTLYQMLKACSECKL